MEADANEKELIDHINETYNLSPEYIFKNFLIIAYSDIKKQKWFGVLMSVPEEKSMMMQVTIGSSIFLI